MHNLYPVGFEKLFGGEIWLQRGRDHGEERVLPGWGGMEIRVPALDRRAVAGGTLSWKSVPQSFRGECPVVCCLWSWAREAGCCVPSREGLSSLFQGPPLCTPVSVAPFCACPPGVTQPRWLPGVGCCLSVAAGLDKASRDC